VLNSARAFDGFSNEVRTKIVINAVFMRPVISFKFDW
jgi:hypothetical protein